MGDVCSRKCRNEGCSKIPSFGVPGTKSAEYGKQNAPDGMINLCSKKGRAKGCGKQPSFGVVHTRMAKCAQHAADGMVNVCSRK